MTDVDRIVAGEESGVNGVDQSLVDADSLVTPGTTEQPINRAPRPVGPGSRPTEHLQDRLALRLSTVCAKPVNWLGIVDAWLVDKGERTDVHLFKLILRGLRVPCFQARYLLFKLSYSMQRRQMVHSYLRHGQGSLPDYADYFPELGLDGLTLSEACERLCEVASGLQEFSELIEAATIVEHRRILQLEARVQVLRERRRRTANGSHSNTDREAN